MSINLCYYNNNFSSLNVIKIFKIIRFRVARDFTLLLVRQNSQSKISLSIIALDLCIDQFESDRPPELPHKIRLAGCKLRYPGV